MIQEQLKSQIVADRILAWLKEHNIAPGTRLKSIRTLADDFSVSTQAITDALDILESEHWIERKKRSGIFVRNPANAFEIGFFLDMQERPDEFQQNLLRLLEPPYRDPEFNFTLKSLSLLDKRYNKELLRNELERFISRNHLSCILFSAPHMTKEEVDICLELPIPVIFLGDFIITENITGNYNQVTIDNYEIARETFAQLFQLTCKKQAVLFLGDEKSYFYSEYAKGAQNAAEEYGAVLHIVYVFPDFPNSLEDRKKEFIAKALAYIPEHKLEDALFCNSIGKSFFEFAEQVNCPCLDRFHYACNSPETMSVFFRRTNQLIRSVVADRNYRKTLICSFQPKVYRYITNGNQI